MHLSFCFFPWCHLRAKRARSGRTVDVVHLLASGFSDRHLFKISLLALCSRTRWLNAVVVNGRILFAEKLNKNRLANHEAISVGKERA